MVLIHSKKVDICSNRYTKLRSRVIFRDIPRFQLLLLLFTTLHEFSDTILEKQEACCFALGALTTWSKSEDPTAFKTTYSHELEIHTDVFTGSALSNIMSCDRLLQKTAGKIY